MGDSLVHWAGVRASERGRPNLNLECLNLKIHWHGQRGMVWENLSTQLQWISLHAQAPRLIIIHLAGNDVVGNLMQKMKRIMGRDFKFLFQNFPDTIIVWSDILPRLRWKFAGQDSSLTALNKKRRRFNYLGRQLVRDQKNGRILHHDITVDCPGLYSADGCHLSDIGYDLFCNSLQGAIECFVTSEAQSFGP